MTKQELLAKVKVGLGNIPSHLDDTISLYIDEVIAYLISAGVSNTLLDLENDYINEKCVGVIIRGVSDLWNYGNGDTKLSEYFYQRADQLRKSKYVSNNVETYLLGTIIKNNFVVTSDTDILNIGISGYNFEKDNLDLFVNGLKFETNRYAIISNTQIKLTYPVTAGTGIEIVVTKVGESNG